jgi:hypothetical protein
MLLRVNVEYSAMLPAGSKRHAAVGLSLDRKVVNLESGEFSHRCTPAFPLLLFADSSTRTGLDLMLW